MANGAVKAATAMKQVTGGTSFGTNATAPPVRLGFTFCGSCHHPTALRGQDNSPVRPQGGGVASVVGRLLPAAKMARARGIAGVAIGNCEKVGWQRVAALSARSAMSSYA